MKFLEGNLSKIVVPPGRRDVLVFNEALSGFAVRKFASGRASFVVKYGVGESPLALSYRAPWRKRGKRHPMCLRGRAWGKAS
jgi:hypothetical protein